MSQGTDIPAAEAMRAADAFIDYLSAWTEKIQVAGSLRRKKPVVHDIEIVAKARIGQIKVPQQSLIPMEYTTNVNVTDARMNTLLQQGVIKEGPPSKTGAKAPFSEKYYKVFFLFEGKDYHIDFFVTTPPADYYVNLLLRTGSAEFSHWIVQQSSFYRFRGGHLDRDGAPIYVQSEQEIFKLLHITYREPWEREVV